jgi:ceramide kinase
VSKLFDIAGVSITAITTTHRGHARAFVHSDPLDHFDGILVFGGDGLINEVVNGMLTRPDHKVLPLGIIPSGSTDALASSILGCRDVQTAALQVILGDRRCIDVGLIESPTADPLYVTHFMGYGYFGDVLHKSEKHRWMGPGRYDYSGCVALAEKRAYSGDVSFVPVDDVDKVKCSAACTTCTQQGPVKMDTESTWETVSGQFMCVNVALLTLSCAKSPEGMAPFAHMSDGAAYLILVRNCWRAQFLRFLIRLATTSQFHDLPYVTVRKCSQIRFTPHLDTRYGHWNVDGELHVPVPTTMKIIPSALPLFTRGIERVQRPHIPLHG